MYYTQYCPNSYSTMNAPAEMEDTDWTGVQALVAEFGIEESEAIEWIEGMGCDLAREELALEQQDDEDETEQTDWRIAA